MTFTLDGQGWTPLHFSFNMTLRVTSELNQKKKNQSKLTFLNCLHITLHFHTEQQSIKHFFVSFTTHLCDVCISNLYHGLQRA